MPQCARKETAVIRSERDVLEQSEPTAPAFAPWYSHFSEDASATDRSYFTVSDRTIFLPSFIFSFPFAMFCFVSRLGNERLYARGRNVGH